MSGPGPSQSSASGCEQLFARSVDRSLGVGRSYRETCCRVQRNGRSTSRVAERNADGTEDTGRDRLCLWHDDARH